MHSKIFQVSLTPISKEEYCAPSTFYDSCYSYADYIGDEMEGEERKECIKHLSHVLFDVFDLDTKNDALIYKGLDKFIGDWVDAIHEASQRIVKENILTTCNTYMLKNILNNTHVDTDYRFNIVDWSDDETETLGNFISYIKYKMLKPGDRVYIGAVIDYHL